MESEPKPDNPSPDLEACRRRIDDLDRRIVELLNERAKVVIDVGRAKRTDGTPIYAPDREQAVLERVARLNGGPIPAKSLQAIYREMMSASFALEKPLRIGHLGPEGSFSHLAAVRKFGASVEYLALADIQAVFEEVARGHCDLGVVPIENSLYGGVIDTMDSFIDAQNMHIAAEVLLAVHHNLLAASPLEDIRVIASKPEALAQCRRWLSTQLSHVQQLPVASTAKAAEMAAAEQNLAAIGSSLAAELYGLKILFENIEDNPNNTTRFFVIGRQPTPRTGQDKTSLIFTTAHQPGTLAEVLTVFANHGINLTNIDTRPSKRRNWEYYFFVDADGHVEDPALSNALKAVREHCGELLILGSYPRANETV